MAKVLTFDIWNTLLDLKSFYRILSEKISQAESKDEEEVFKKINEAYKKALKMRLEGNFRRIIIDSAEVFSSEIGITSESLFRAVSGAIEDPRISSLAYSDALPALSSLKKMNMRLVLLGNVMFWPGMVTRIILMKNGILDYFDFSIFSDEVGVSKPSKEMFDMVSKKFNCNNSEIIHVGDSLENDFAGALLAGAKAVLIKRDIQTPILVLGKNAYVINSLTHLREVVIYSENELSK